MKKILACTLVLMMLLISLLPMTIVLGSTDDHHATNLILRDKTFGLGGQALMFSWKNPKVSTITSVALYDGDGNVIKDDFATTAGMVQTHTVSGLTNGTFYTYKLVITFSDAETKEYIYTAKPVNNVSSNSGYGSTDVNWEISYNRPDAATPYPPVLAEVVKLSDAPEGQAAMKITSNIPNWQADYFATLKYTFRAALGETLESGKQYRLSFSYKNKADGSRVPLSISGASDVFRFNMNTDGWQTGYLDLTAGTGTTNFQIKIEQQQEGLLLDNFQLHELEGDSITGENILADGGFEKVYENFVIDSPQSLTAAAGDRSAVLTYTYSSANINYLNLYREENGVLHPCGIIYPEANTGTIVFNHLKNNQTYRFVLKAVSNGFTESETGVEATVTPKAEPVIVSDYTLQKGGLDADKITQGSYSASITIKNNEMGDDFNGELFAVLYKGNAMYKAYTSTKINIPQTASDLTPTTLSISNIEIPDVSDDTYTLKLMLWTGLREMESIKRFIQFTE